MIHLRKIYNSCVCVFLRGMRCKERGNTALISPWSFRKFNEIDTHPMPPTKQLVAGVLLFVVANSWALFPSMASIPICLPTPTCVPAPSTIRVNRLGQSFELCPKLPSLRVLQELLLYFPPHLP